MNDKKYPLPNDAAKAAAGVICDFLKNRRLELGLTLDDVADRMGVGKATVSKIENAKWNISIEMMIKWCYALHCNPFISSIEENSVTHEQLMAQLGRRPDSLPQN